MHSLLIVLTSILVSNQQEFDALERNIHGALASHPSELTVTIAPGHYYFHDDHIALQGEKHPETKLTISGEGAILEGSAPDVEMTGFFRLTRPVEVVDADRKLCRIRTRKRLFGQGKSYVQITSWYRLFTAPVTEIKGGYIYFSVNDLSRSGMTYNINGDVSYGKQMPRCRLLLSREPSEPATAFFKLTDCEFQSVSVSGMAFTRNTGGRTEYAKDCLIRFYKCKFDQAVVRECDFRSIGSDVIHIAYADGVEVLNCRFTDCYRIGVLSYNHAGRTVVKDCSFQRMDLSAENNACVVCSGTDYRISGNRFEDYGNCAMRLGLHFTEDMKFPSSGIVEQNEIYQTAAYGKVAPMRLLMDTGAIYVCTQNTSLEIRNNHIHDISGPCDNRGIFCDDGTVNTHIRNNEIVRVANSYCIDLRRALSVETRSDSKIRRVNVGNRVENNMVDGRIRFEKR